MVVRDNPMPRGGVAGRLTARQEKFAEELFRGVKQYEAWGNAGYSTRYSLARIASNACDLAHSMKVKCRLAELQAAVDKSLVMDFEERQKRLTQIARAEIPDYVTEDGIKVTKQSPNVGAVSEITAKTRVDRHGPVVITNLKLHSPLSAIDLLNKMDKLYSDNTVNIDNRKIEVVFVNKDSAKAVEGRIADTTPSSG